MSRRVPRLLLAAAIGVLAPPAAAQDDRPPGPSRIEAMTALRDAAEFFHWRASSFGGYVWRYSADLADRRGEAVVGETTIWVQPPGTPSVGEAMLDAYLATGAPDLLDAARDAGHALCKGQMHSGGWTYSVEFDPARRLAFDYRENPGRAPDLKSRSGRERRLTNLDDDTTQSATRFLTRLDAALDFEDARIHEAAGYALESILRAQHPNGGWYAWWDTFPEPPSEADYPVTPASYPETWKREWPNDWLGRYVLNDHLMSDMVDTLLLAHRTYDDPRYLDAARKAGDFLILAQMPDPQPAWAQQYNVAMQPEWSRKFEPPAISGYESQTIIESLLLLYRATGDAKYLAPVPRALDYLRRSQFPDGRIARFFELKTNKPLYFTKDYKLTYSSDDMPDHYGFIQDSQLDRLAAEYARLRESGAPSTAEPARTPPALTPEFARRAREVIDALDERGAWVGKANNGSPIIESATFAENLRVLADYIAASNPG